MIGPTIRISKNLYLEFALYILESMKKTNVDILTPEAKVLSSLYNRKLTRSELAEVTGIGYSSISYMVLRLESIGLIRTVGTRKVKNGPMEDVYEISEKGIDILKNLLTKEIQYIEILLKLKETAISLVLKKNEVENQN